MTLNNDIGMAYKEPTSDEILDEYRFECEYDMNHRPPVKYKQEFPNKLTDWNKVYMDQGINTSVFGDRRITSIHLETGLKRIDGFFAREIQRHHNNYSKKELMKMIKNNSHLHNIIKTNLLANLENYEQSEK